MRVGFPSFEPGRTQANAHIAYYVANKLYEVSIYIPQSHIFV